MKKRQKSKKRKYNYDILPTDYSSDEYMVWFW